jgi:hypothetical protein
MNGIEELNRQDAKIAEEEEERGDEKRTGSKNIILSYSFISLIACARSSI